MTAKTEIENLFKTYKMLTPGFASVKTGLHSNTCYIELFKMEGEQKVKRVCDGCYEITKLGELAISEKEGCGG